MALDIWNMQCPVTTKVPPAKHRRRRLIVAVLVLAVGLHSLYWWRLSRALEDGSQAWIQQKIAAGWQIQSGPATTGGWPLAATRRFPDFSVTEPARLGWNPQLLVLTLDLWRPDHLLVDAPGRQRLMLAGRGDATLAAGRLRLDMKLGSDDAPFSFDLDVADIQLPLSLPLLFGPLVAHLSAAGQISHFSDSTDGVTILARKWRDRGGNVDLRQFALRWGKLDLSGRAVLALDGRLQPEGKATAVVAGFADAAGELAAGGSVPPQAAMLAIAALSMLSNDAGTAEVPLQLHGGRLSMRQVPLMRVPDLVWPPR
jgi:hypothetical protein